MAKFVGEIRYDGYAILGSSILLLLLLAILFERVLGLDRIFARFLKKMVASRRDQRRKETAKYRLDLEKLFKDNNDTE